MLAIKEDKDRDLGLVINNTGDLAGIYKNYCKGNSLKIEIRGRECSSKQVPEITTNVESYEAFSDTDLSGIYEEEKGKEAKGNFKAIPLHTKAQTGPTLDVQIQDMNKIGRLDIIGVRAVHQAEVETIRC